MDISEVMRLARQNPDGVCVAEHFVLDAPTPGRQGSRDEIEALLVSLGVDSMFLEQLTRLHVAMETFRNAHEKVTVMAIDSPLRPGLAVFVKRIARPTTL